MDRTLAPTLRSNARLTDTCPTLYSGEVARSCRGIGIVALGLALGCGGHDSGQEDAAVPADAAAAIDAVAQACTAATAAENCDDLNSCTADTCPDGSCVHTPDREGERCNDLLDCTDPDVCENGECVSQPLDCSYLNDACNVGECQEEPEGTGECQAVPVAGEPACEDGLFCTEGDKCVDGECVPGPDRDCSEVEDQCNGSECREDLAECVPVPLDQGCQDGKFCTDNDRCQDVDGVGACIGGAAPDCADTDPCTDDSCDIGLDECVHDPVPPIPGAEGPTDDATCSDGLDNDCDGDFDTDDSECVDCSGDNDCDTGDDCSHDWCDGVHCHSDPLTDTSCEDGDFCTDGDTCAAGLCIPGGPLDCADVDSCTVDSCDEDDNQCVHDPRTADPASPVATSADDGSPLSVCLVAGSGARVVVWTDLLDTGGQPLEGAEVTIGDLAATESTDQPGSYYAVWPAADAPSSQSLSVVATSCGEPPVTLDQTVAVDTVAANASAGGTGGCNSESGNLRIKVVAEETGAPIAGAQVLVGMAEATPFELAAEALFGGASTPGSNLATTDADGYVELYDYGTVLTGPVTITAGATDRALFTLVDVAASDIVLPLPLIHPAAPATTTYDQGTADTSLYNMGSLDLALVLPRERLGFFSTFDVRDVFSEYRCWDSQNGTFGQMAVPGNLWIPSKYLIFVGTIAAAPWSLTLPNSVGADRENVMLGHVRIPLSDVDAVINGGGSIADLLAVTDYRRLGFMLDEQVPTLPTSGRSITADNSYPNSFTVTYVNRPTDTDVIGFTLGDYSGQNGTGALFMMGHKVHAYDVSGSTVAIPNSDLGGTTAPSGIRRLASISAMYNDPEAHPAIAANRLDGVSTVLIRQAAGGGEPFGASGGTATVSDMLGIVGATESGPTRFTWENAIRNGNVPMYSRHELTVRTRRYRFLHCDSSAAPEDDIRTEFSTQWIVVKRFGLDCSGQECFSLPTLPASFPRQSTGTRKKSGFETWVGSGIACTGDGDCAAGESCVDPDRADADHDGPEPRMCMAGAGTAGDPYYLQDYSWRLHVYDLGLAPAGWSLDQFTFADHDAEVTHEVWNRQGFQ